MSDESIATVVTCDRHGINPYHVVCRHVIYDPLVSWEEVEVGDDDGREVNNDWLCPACADANDADANNLDDLMIVCMMCVREIRESRGLDKL